jgi:hypothetical protein
MVSYKEARQAFQAYVYDVWLHRRHLACI